MLTYLLVSKSIYSSWLVYQSFQQTRRQSDPRIFKVLHFSHSSLIKFNDTQAKSMNSSFSLLPSYLQLKDRQACDHPFLQVPHVKLKLCKYSFYYITQSLFKH